jgi:4-alpha-glucanotransferase
VSVNQRVAGVLLHPTSLPGTEYEGKLGDQAFRFVDFLAESGVGIWQVLPLGPTLEDKSPYQSPSVHAGNAKLISIQKLADKGWLTEEQQQAHSTKQLIKLAYQGFLANASEEDNAAYADFCEHHQYWLDDYACYYALKEQNDFKAWWEWPEKEKNRDASCLKTFCQKDNQQVDLYRFQQFVFFEQWLAIKAYANERRIRIVGDIPIFVAHDSAEVWSHRDCFDLDENGQPSVVAGVPPDYFSETGQRWGNPHYEWDYIESTGFQWWKDRVKTQRELCDIVRVDHFRGFEAYWEIPSSEETAINGRWVKAPGAALFTALREEFGDLPFLAEDLGIITDEVDALRDQFDFPGMKILQFAFDNNPNNTYLPHEYTNNTVVYTGTHDNDTTLSWYCTLTDEERARVDDYAGGCVSDHPWPLIRVAIASCSQYAILPMQDFLCLGGEHRMNTPGTTKGNWGWQFEWSQLPEGLAGRIFHLIHRYGRAV